MIRIENKALQTRKRLIFCTRIRKGNMQLKQPVSGARVGKDKSVCLILNDGICQRYAGIIETILL